MNSELTECPYCQGKPIVDHALPEWLVSGPESSKVFSIKCESGCMGTRGYLVVKSSEKQWESLTKHYAGIIKKAINTVPPIFRQK